MGIFGFGGSKGLPPLDGDERRSGRCHTQGCNRLTTSGLPFCNPCISARVKTAALEGDEALDALPTRPLTDVEIPALPPVMAMLRQLDGPSFAAAAASELAAPLFVDAWLDHRCRWCCHIMSERVANAAVGGVRPTAPNFTCERHRIRRKAHKQVLKMFEYLCEKCRYDSGDIAEFYQFGYLGDRLTDDQQMP